MAYFRARDLKIAFLITLIFLNQPLLSWAGGSHYPVKSVPFTPAPSEAIINQWTDDYGQIEPWCFKTHAELEKFLANPALDAEAVKALRSRMLEVSNYDPKSTNPVARLHYLFAENSSAEVGIALDAETRKLLPKNFSNQIRALQISDGFNVPVWGRFSSEDETVDFLERSLISKKDVDELKSVERYNAADGYYEIPVSPDSWKLFSVDTRKKFIQDQINANRTWVEGVQLSVEIANAQDIHQVALEYAGNRNPKALERYLKLRLGNQPKATVPLKDFIYRFARKNDETFALCDGPNCFNTAVNAESKTLAKTNRQFLSSRELLAKLEQDYRAVPSSEPLRMGDLLLYSSTEGKIQHAASYINPDFSFTKDGVSKLSPYGFQTHAAIEKAYFEGSDFKLNVYRHQSPEVPAAKLTEQTVLATPYFQGRTHRERGLTAQLSDAERAEVSAGASHPAAASLPVNCNKQAIDVLFHSAK